MTSVFIHQPEYFPWTHFFEKLYKSDIVVLLDSVQYSRRSFQNRNIVFSETGSKWITVPIIKSPRETKINDIKINNKIEWQELHRDILTKLYSDNIYFDEINNLFKKVFENKWENLSDLNIYIIKKIIKYFNLNKKIFLSSELKLKNKKSDLILEICNFFKVNEYVTGLGSKSYLDQKRFIENNINIIYLEPKNNFYNQYNYKNFVPNLSILDYLYNNGNKTQLIK